MTAVLSPQRAGRITGSRVAAILGANRYSRRIDVMRELVREAWGDPSEFDGNDATRYGQLHEADAVAAYEAERGVLVHSQQEFVIHPDYDYLAVTVDGFVGDDGLIECKCPYSGRYRHIDEKPDHEAQIRFQLAVTGREWGDYCVWADREPVSISRVEHDPLWLPEVLPKLRRFMDEFRRTAASADLSLPYRFTDAALVPELIRQRDQARRIACELETENASLLDTVRDKELRD